MYGIMLVTIPCCKTRFRARHVLYNVKVRIHHRCRGKFIELRNRLRERFMISPKTVWQLEKGIIFYKLTTVYIIVI